MSARPIEAKQRRRAAKAIRRQPIQARYFDIVQWLIDHKHAKSRKHAREILLAKRVSANSHPVGWESVPMFENEKLVEKDVVVKHVPVKLKRDLVVAAA